MRISEELTTNCRLIDPPALGSDPAIGGPARAMLDILTLPRAREFSMAPLSQYQLSRLLWASQACGPDFCPGGPMQGLARPKIDVYVAAPDGLYLYDAQACHLRHAVREDVRALCGTPEIACTAAITLIYALALACGPQNAVRHQAAMIAAAFSQNVALMCAAEGLAAVTQVLVAPEALAQVMGLPCAQCILLTQTVGWPPR